MFSVAVTASTSALIRFHGAFYICDISISSLMLKVQVILFFNLLWVFPMCKSMQEEISLKTAHEISIVNPVPYTFLFNGIAIHNLFKDNVCIY